MRGFNIMRLSKKNQKAFEDMIQNISASAQIMAQKREQGKQEDYEFWSKQLQLDKEHLRKALGIDLINTI